MAVDYNLVILGGSLTARYAADVASRFKARVALVEPPIYAVGLTGGEDEAIALQALQSWVESGGLPRSAPFASPTDIQEGPPRAASSPLDWSALQNWMQAAVKRHAAGRSLAQLAVQGVDVITGNGEFCRRPQFGVIAEGRLLRGHAYLLAPPSRPVMPAIEGLADVPYLTLDALVLQEGRSLSGHTVILGGSPRSLELAQTLTRTGLQVTLLVSQPTLLPEEDEEAARLVLALLEASGVQVHLNAAVQQVKGIEGKVWLQVGDRAIAADHLVLALGRSPDWTALNLGAAAIKPDPEGLPVDAQLRTVNRRVYACGEAIAPLHLHSPLAFEARLQAEIAVKNALFWPTRSIHDLQLPHVLHTTPPLARVGLTEQQAQQRLGRDWMPLCARMHQAPSAHIHGETTGFCKLITRRNGVLVGAHLFGPDADAWIHTLALALERRTPIQSLTLQHDLAQPFAALLAQMQQDWGTTKLKGDRLRYNLLELLLAWRRDWSRG